MEEIQENKDNRRDFLKKIGLFSAGIAAGAGALYSGFHYQKSKTEGGKKLRLLTSDNQLVEVDSLEIKAVVREKNDPTVLGREGIEGKRFVMVIDLSKCQNERKCIAACQSAHHLKPDQYHINVLQMQDSPETALYNRPKPCQHCDNPPCVSVCPVDATFKRQDGIVLIDNQRCIGCRFCMSACPYSARIFQWLEPKDAEKDKNIPYNIELNVPQKKGTISKCLFSADRLRIGQLPYCVSACPNGVYWFGDENEDAVTNGTTKETTRLSTLLRENGATQLMPELGTKPRVYYLANKGRTNPFKPSPDLFSDKNDI